MNGCRGSGTWISGWDGDSEKRGEYEYVIWPVLHVPFRCEYCGMGYEDEMRFPFGRGERGEVLYRA